MQLLGAVVALQPLLARRMHIRTLALMLLRVQLGVRVHLPKFLRAMIAHAVTIHLLLHGPLLVALCIFNRTSGAHILQQLSLIVSLVLHVALASDQPRRLLRIRSH